MPCGLWSSTGSELCADRGDPTQEMVVTPIALTEQARDSTVAITSSYMTHLVKSASCLLPAELEGTHEGAEEPKTNEIVTEGEIFW